jgi:hypothetical protein
LQSGNKTTFAVSKVSDANVTSEIENTTAGEPAVVKVTVPDDATGNVTITIGNITKTVPVTGGENEIIIPGVPVGEHNVTITYNGDDKYNPQTITDKLAVLPENTTEDDIKVNDLNNGTLIIEVPENATGTVTVVVDGENYTAVIENGKAIVDLTNATPGDHNVSVIYSGD